MLQTSIVYFVSPVVLSHWLLCYELPVSFKGGQNVTLVITFVLSSEPSVWNSNFTVTCELFPGWLDNLCGAIGDLCQLRAVSLIDVHFNSSLKLGYRMLTLLSFLMDLSFKAFKIRNWHGYFAVVLLICFHRFLRLQCVVLQLPQISVFLFPNSVTDQLKNLALDYRFVTGLII